MLNLVPAILPEDKWERNAIMSKARVACYHVLVAWEAENGSQYPTQLSYRTTQTLDSLVNGTYEHPDKWNDRVRIYFGEAPSGNFFDWRNRMGVLIRDYKDVHYDEALEVLESERYGEYKSYRRDGVTHAEAMKYIETAHFHEYTSETTGTRNHILGTHDLRTVFTCECGDSYETRSVNNYSGD